MQARGRAAGAGKEMGIILAEAPESADLQGDEALSKEG